jgi:hypothetical protein
MGDFLDESDSFSTTEVPSLRELSLGSLSVTKVGMALIVVFVGAIDITAGESI